jgi:hypothetical protein
MHRRLPCAIAGISQVGHLEDVASFSILCPGIFELFDGYAGRIWHGGIGQYLPRD